MGSNPDGERTLDQECAERGLTLVGVVHTEVGTFLDAPVPADVSVTATEHGAQLAVGEAAAVILRPDEALHLADHLFQAVLLSRDLKLGTVQVQHAKAMFESLGLQWL